MFMKHATAPQRVPIVGQAEQAAKVSLNLSKNKVKYRLCTPYMLKYEPDSQ